MCKILRLLTCIPQPLNALLIGFVLGLLRRPPQAHDRGERSHTRGDDGCERKPLLRGDIEEHSFLPNQGYDPCNCRRDKADYDGKGRKSRGIVQHNHRGYEQCDGGCRCTRLSRSALRQPPQGGWFRSGCAYVPATRHEARFMIWAPALLFL